VGDVAGHGISSALLMATVRSAMRQRIASPGSISQVIADVNNQLVGDFVGAASSRDRFNSRLEAAPTGVFFLVTWTYRISA
jgi:hypothetical protein